MDFRPIRRLTIALAAAYAVALQALLAAFVPATPAVLLSPLAVLCAHDAGDGTNPPADHDWPCAGICAAMGHGIAGPVPASGVVAVIAQPHVVASLTPTGEWVPPQIALTATHAPRGPPLA
jgi:hypothetical protein